MLVAAVGSGIYEAHQASQLRKQVQTLQQQQAPLAGQIQQLQSERDDATNQLTTLVSTLANYKGNDAELLKLRAEVTRLRGDSQKPSEPNDPEEATVREWTARVKASKNFIKETPGCQIPEYQFLDETDWFMAIEVSNNAWRTDVDIKRNVVPNLTERAKEHFAGVMINALREFLAENGGQLPTQLAELKPFFKVPVGNEVLDRYELLHSGNVKDLPEYNRKNALVSEKKSVADSSTQVMMQMGDTSFRNLTSF